MQATDAPLQTDRSSASKFPVVCLGASAGGVEALQQFFQGLVTPCGMGFVVVQHMDPRHVGKLVEILQRYTSMPVQQADEKVPVAPDHVYVTPSDRDLAIFGGALAPIERKYDGATRLPIDFFMRSLAADLHDLSVAVILSGMGSDGTMGLRAIKEVAGSIFVQDPDTAMFDSMPRSAVATGLADVVAPASALASKVVAYCNFKMKHGSAPVPTRPHNEQTDLDRIIVLLHTQTRQDFSLYKKSTLLRRIERRMALHQLHSIADYQRYLRQNSHEAELLFKDLLIGVTRFFRDPEVWQQFKAQCLPALLAAHPAGGTLRAWTPACASGEEAYTLAMVFREAVEELRPEVPYNLQIFATDLDSAAIETARLGLYPPNISADVSEARLQRFFTPQASAYRVSRDIRDMVVFAQQNLVMDPPFTNLDVLSCRNLLIYMESALQRKLLSLFHYCLKPQGILVLGSAESTGDASGQFTELAGKMRIYLRRNVTARSDPIDFPPVFNRAQQPVNFMGSNDSTAEQSTPDLQLLTNALLLQGFAPAALLTTDLGEIIYICGKAGKFLEPSAGRLRMNLFSMARDDLAAALSDVLLRAVRENSTVTLPSVQLSTSEGIQTVDITIQPLSKPAALRGMVLLVFKDLCPALKATEAPPQSGEVVMDTRMTAMAQEMQQIRDALKTSREEMQTSQEELKSTNEELQSTNEELQSSNEELMTSKEEMQSINEELQSVNRELAAKAQQMQQSSEEVITLLNSTAIATLFLDAHMRVRRFTAPATELFKLIPGDVGRPITDLVTTLNSPLLEKAAREVLRTLVHQEALVSSQDNRWYQVRTMPYRTRDNHIDGVVITFVDVSAKKMLEARMLKALALLQQPDDTPQNILAQVRSVLEQLASPAPTDAGGA